MELNKNELQITNTTPDDLPIVFWLFEEATRLQGRAGYKVWQEIDKAAVESESGRQLQFKITIDNDILCVFSIQYSDPFIWQERDRQDAIYLHRIVANPNIKGHRLFEHVLNWAKAEAAINNLKFVRMDTWADNHQLIAYYQSFGFQFIEEYKTSNAAELPIQNRNLTVALLELAVE